jgi:lipopolysaccharide transport system ATP-binding protein
MSEIAIRCEGLGKRYRIGTRERYRALRDSITETVSAPLRRLRSSFVKTGAQASNGHDHIWALKDVSFEINQGEVIGVIGPNGAGKSTLLKILSRITKPTAGRVEIKGRLGSLLEVGTGFHPELTGRENVYLNGAIMGMRKAEIERKFDEIVAFAEVEKFLDTPVKRYSSGMYVRLAFAVAAHMEPETLLVDEVLAVGDAAFQKKCLGKMEDVAHEGRTVLFVSHNMGAITQLCSKAMLLESGRLTAFTRASEATQLYLRASRSSLSLDSRRFAGTLLPVLEFRDITINDSREGDALVIPPSSKIKVKVAGQCKRDVPAFRTTFSVFKDGVRLLTLHDLSKPELLPKGSFEAEVEIPPFFLRPGEYSLAIGGYRDGMNEWIWGTDLAAFTIVEEWDNDYDPINIGIVNLPHKGERKLLSEIYSD